jgi:uncharacterized protein YkwD
MRKVTRFARLAAAPLAAIALAGLALPAAAAARGPNPIAPASACPNQAKRAVPIGVQLQAMLCMTNYARHFNGLEPLTRSQPLARAANHKSADILSCDKFSHEACGRDFTYWMERFGYLHGCWRAAENIGYGTGTLGTVREVFSAWMSSAGHRANILGEFGEIGIGRRVGNLAGTPGAVVWTQDFGTHGC